ncbi:MAG: DUF6391 domain-containing protein [Deltaproteobacteria bacterium]
MNILETRPISTIRRNHGIEHATVHVLTQWDPNIRLVGRADTTGFNIYGSVPPDMLEKACKEALERMKNGESQLAVHRGCGTQIVVAGLLTGMAAALAIGRRPRLSKLPDAILATTLAAFVSQPVGLQVQEKITTSADVQAASFAGIRSSRLGSYEFQHVDINWES